NGGGDGDHHGDDGEGDAEVDALSGDEHMVSPDEEAEDGNGEAGEGDELVAEDAVFGEAGDDFADDAETGEDHDVHGGVRIEPEKVLEEYGVSAKRGVEDADAPEAFE